METKIIAYCGITCSSCEAYLATQSGDHEALERVAAAWREAYDPNITVASVICDGCLVDTERVCSNCPVCPVRLCAKERGVASCAHCDDYVCEHLERHFTFAPEMREVLDAIREAYLGTGA